MDNKIFKQLFHGVDEKHLARAFEKVKNDGCPDGKKLMAWFGKLAEAEIINDALRNDKDEYH